MIPIAAAAEPSDFDAHVRQPGLRAIAELCGKPPPIKRTAGRPFKKIADREIEIPIEELPPYWFHSLDELMKRYDEICAYSCFRIHRVTGARSADHFAAKSRHWKRAYEWSNYRLCCSRLNARKRAVSTVLDPFQIKARTIDRLGLDDFCHVREEDAELYWSKDVSLRVLRQESPFVAEELRRQGRLNPGDSW